MKEVDVVRNAFVMPLTSPSYAHQRCLGGPIHDLALALLTQLPVRKVISATHILTDLTLGLGKVVHDYLAWQYRDCSLRIKHSHRDLM